MIDIENIPIKEELKEFVKKLTLFKSDGSIDYQQRIMPSMYSYLSYNAYDIPTFKTNNLNQQPQSRLQVIGPKTNTDIRVNHIGTIQQLMVEFSSFGLYALYRKSPQQYCNKLNNYEDLVNSQNLIRELKHSQNIEDKASVMQRHLTTFIKNSQEVDERIKKAISILEERKGVIKVKELCEEVNMGVRNFNRNFTEITGVSPQLYARIHQLHNIIAEFAKDSNSQILDVAYLSGFYDHPHFNRTFKKLVNLSPSQFLKSKEHISLKYFAS